MALHRGSEPAHVVHEEKLVEPRPVGAEGYGHVPRGRDQRRGRDNHRRPQTMPGVGRRSGQPSEEGPVATGIGGGLPPGEQAHRGCREHQADRPLGQHGQTAGSADSGGGGSGDPHRPVPQAPASRARDRRIADKQPESERREKGQRGVGCGGPAGDAAPQAGGHRDAGPESDVGAEQHAGDPPRQQAGAQREQGRAEPGPGLIDSSGREAGQVQPVDEGRFFYP